MKDLLQEEEQSERFPTTTTEPEEAKPELPFYAGAVPSDAELAAAEEAKRAATEPETTAEESVELLPSDAEISGDYIVNLETGEVYGFAAKPEFSEIKTDENAYWVLDRINQAEARLAAAKIREEAVLENCRRMRATEEAIVKWLRTVYEGQLIEWAKPQLAGKKAKSVKTPFGTVGFRASGGGIKVNDPTLAERWASEFEPDAVKVERTFQISKISDETKSLITRIHRGDPIWDNEKEAAEGIRTAFRVDEPVDKGYVDTGVKFK